jgi:ABC-type glycerol-3-phosphate transport system substrate-binding protein
MRYWPVFALALFVALVSGATPGAVSAQSNAIITLAAPQNLRQQLESGGVIEAFEAQNPGVDVVVEYVANTPISSPAAGMDSYLEDMQTFVEQGDVLYVGTNSIAPEATRSGLFLDLSPLTNGDPSLNVNDFYPQVWLSFQWDGGVWALPVTTSVTGLTYDPDAFDAAGLAYPSTAWTIDDLANAARALAVRDSSGAVTTPGLTASSNNVGLLFRSLTGQPFYDSNTLPTNPNLATPELEALLTTWKTLIDEGVVAVGGGGRNSESPMTIGSSFIAVRATRASNGSTAIETVSETLNTLLPGGHAGLSANGFAVSAGTQYPEQSYALARFLTTRPELTFGFGLSSPARQSLAGASTSTGGPGGGGPGGGGPISFSNSPETEAFISDALANGLPYAEYRFSNYVGTALSQMTGQGLDALTALQNVEATAITNLQTADATRGQLAVMVPTPVPTPVLQSGEIALNFGVQQMNLLVANKDLWDQVINEFVASDPQVGQVIVDAPTGFGNDVSTLASSFECFYMPSNAVPDMDLSLVLNLDPFMDTDPTFSRSDVVGNTLSQLQRDNRTWAFPIMIQPVVMRYDRNQFALAGVPEPTNGWTLDAFVDALNRLKDVTAEGAPFSLGNLGSTNLLMLIAAYGGLPVDYRTDPETINLTDPATVAAIQQVLDLAKNGLLAYSAMGQMGGGTTVTEAAESPAIQTQTLGGGGGMFGGGMGVTISITGGPGAQANTDYALTTFPTGSQYTALSYNIGTAYISATAQNPDACYRLISTLSLHPELFGSMPARRSLINSPSVLAAQGEDAVAVYSQIDTMMQSPNTVIFPAFFGGGTPATFLTQMWLNQAFDAYVIDNADLATELAEAQTYITAFDQCVAALPAFDPATQSQPQYFDAYINCATQIDPNFATMFGG